MSSSSSLGRNIALQRRPSGQLGEGRGDEMWVKPTVEKKLILTFKSENSHPIVCSTIRSTIRHGDKTTMTRTP
jgi:hypothetical protein